MGRGIQLECRNCHYSFRISFGVGFLFPQAYQETMEAAKNGKFGKKVQTFLAEHPDGALDCDLVLFQCPSCDNLDRGLDLSMYVPRDKPVVHEGRWSSAYPFEEVSYVTPRDLEEHYKLVEPYDHVCGKCGSRMRVIKEADLFPNGQNSKKDEKTGVNCPKCREPMFVGGQIMWD